MEVKLVKVIQPEIQKTQGAVIQSITDALERHTPIAALQEDIGAGCQHAGDNPPADMSTVQPPAPSDSAPIDDVRGVVPNVQASSPTQRSTNNGCQIEVDDLISTVISDVACLANHPEVC